MRALPAILLLLFLPLVGCLEVDPTPAASDTGVPVPYTVLVEGPQSGHRERIVTMIDTSAAWEAFWEKHDRTGTERRPEVDFARYHVAAVVLGEKPNGCHGVSISAVTRDDDTARDVVSYTETIPGPDAFCTQAIVSPFSFAAFERKHAVAFRGETKTVGEPRADEPSFRVLDRGSQSGFPDSTKRVLNEEAAWTEFWALHAPRRDRPQVDFANERVAAVVLGERGNACYGASIEAVEVDPDTGATVVRYVEQRPPAGRACAEMITNPFVIVAFTPAAGGVTFEGRVATW